MKSKRWIRSIALASAILLAAAGHSLAQQLSAVDGVQKDLQQQQQILMDRTAADPDSLAQQQLRDEAARRLVSRSSQEADGILLRVLSDFGNRHGQLAVARALANDPTPEAAFITPLANLLGTDPARTGAAGMALAVFKDDERARERLTAFASDLSQQPNTRAAVIKALGKLVDKRTATLLMRTLTRDDENRLVREAAAEALQEMTGLRYGYDTQQWSNWWKYSQNKTDLEWAMDLLYRNATRAEEGWRRLRETREFATRLMRDEYQDKRTPEPERIQKLIGYLRSDREDVRLSAVQIIQDEAVSFGGTHIAAEILETLRKMVGDSSTEVRMLVAQALATVNDPGAVEALLAQLSQEKDAGVQAAILSALGPSRDLRAVGEMLKRLSDASTPYSVATAAADALRDLAPTLREKNPTLASQVAQHLRQRLKSTTPDVSAVRLRESLAGAMSRLGDSSLIPVFYELLNPQETTEVRIAAIRGLGLIGDKDSANMVVNMLNDDQDRVRLAAAEALRTTATFANAEAIARHLSPTVERSAEVREMIWSVLSQLFEQATANELFLWVERFKGDTELDLTRRIRVLAVLETKLADSTSQRNLAMVRQTHGEVLLKLSKLKNDPAVAITAAAKLKQALDYWISHNATEAEINMPRQQYMQALLQAGKDTEAASFAAKLLQANKSVQGDMWRNINEEVARRRESRNLDAALALIEAAKKLPWVDVYGRQLQLLEDAIRKERGTGGHIWWVRDLPQFEYVLFVENPPAA